MVVSAEDRRVGAAAYPAGRPEAHPYALGVARRPLRTDRPPWVSAAGGFDPEIVESAGLFGYRRGTALAWTLGEGSNTEVRP